MSAVRVVRATVTMLATAALAASPVHAFLIRGSVVASGAQLSASGAHRLSGTVGQGVVGGSLGSGFFTCHGFWCFGGSRVVSVEWEPDDGPGRDLPDAIAFGAPTPNPARGEVRFSVALPVAARVTFAVYDVAGRQLGESVTRSFEAGRHELRWSAPEGNAGVYFGRLHVDGAVPVTRRVVLVR